MDEDSLSDNSGNLENSDDDGNDRVPCTSHDQIHPKQLQSDGAPKLKKKRKRKEGRKRIRKILSDEQLDSETLSAQKEEQERLRRLELQKSLNTVPTARSTSPLDKSSPHLETTKVPAQPVVVDVPCKVTDRIIVIDDSDDECNIIDKPLPASACVIISDSESEHSSEEENEADEEPENSGSHTNDDVNQPDVHGRVLVNVNHPPTEPDIFLASHLCSLAKPHQVIVLVYCSLWEASSS